MRQTLRDRRRLPFFQVVKADLAALIAACEDATVKLSSVRSVYFALLEIANDARGDTAELSRAMLGERAGVSSRTVFDAMAVLVSGGLLEVQENPGAPNAWTLLSADDDPGNHCRGVRQPLPGSYIESEVQEGRTPPKPPEGVGEVETLWGRFVEMRQLSKKQLRRTEIDQQTSRMIAASLEVGSVEEWSKAIDAILLSPHHRGENDRGRVYLEPRHIFTACSHGTVRQHLDWLLDLSQIAGDGVTSALNAKVRQAKVNVVAAFDLAGSAAARRKGDESREFLAQHGISVVFDGSGGRPRFEESASPQR